MEEKKLVLKRTFYYDFCMDGDIVYFPMANYSFLCKGYFAMNQLDVIGAFPETPVNDALTYIGVYKSKKYLLLCPYKKENYILLYDVEHDMFIKLAKKEKLHFFGSTVFEKKDCLYIVSKENAGIYKINLQKFSVECISPEEYMEDNAQVGEIIREEDSLYIPINSKGILLIFDLQIERFMHYKFPQNISTINTICCRDSELWLTGEEKKIYVWNIEKMKIYECDELPNYINLFYHGNVWFGNSFVHKNVLWLFPVYADRILKYDIEKKHYEEFKLYGEEEIVEEIEEELRTGRFFPVKYGVVKRNGNKVYFLSSKTRILYELDLDTEGIEKHIFYNDQIDSLFVSGVLKEETYVDGLGYLMNGLIRKDQNTRREKEKCVGKTINAYMKVSK